MDCGRLANSSQAMNHDGPPLQPCAGMPLEGGHLTPRACDGLPFAASLRADPFSSAGFCLRHQATRGCQVLRSPQDVTGRTATDRNPSLGLRVALHWWDSFLSTFRLRGPRAERLRE